MSTSRTLCSVYILGHSCGRGPHGSGVWVAGLRSLDTGCCLVCLVARVVGRIAFCEPIRIKCTFICIISMGIVTIVKGKHLGYLL